MLSCHLFIIMTFNHLLFILSSSTSLLPTALPVGALFLGPREVRKTGTDFWNPETLHFDHLLLQSSVNSS